MYLVIEIQATNGTIAVLPVATFNELQQAESSYHYRIGCCGYIKRWYTYCCAYG